MARWAVRAGSVAWDVAVATLVLFVALLGTPAVAHRQAVPGLDSLGYLLLTAAGAPLVWWRRRPRAAFVVTCLAVTLYLGLGYPLGPILVAEPIAVYGLSRRCPPRQTVAWLGALLAATALAVVTRVTAGPEGWDWARLGALLAWAALPAAAGIVTRVRRDLAANLRAERARLAATEERLRVAQEVHDVVGHGLAVIAMQSGVALHILQRNPEKARAPLEAIRATSLDSLNDLRRELGMLRGIDEPSAAGRTHGGRAELEVLVDRIRAGGVAVTSDLDPVLDGLPVDVRRAVYRIVQEALTNVLRHAGPEAGASVTLRGNGSVFEVDVTDTGTGPTVSDGAGEGSGIQGMRNRVASLGGQLVIGPVPGAGFRVHASIPLPGPTRPPAGSAR